MGTAVLVPQDCLLTSKSRHKPNFTYVLYGSSSPPRARGGTSHASDSCFFYPDQSRQKFNVNKKAGWSATPGSIPLPEHCQAFTKTELDGKKPKARRPIEARDVTFASKPGPDVPAFTILQRPKDRELADELIAKFLVELDEPKQLVGLLALKSDVKTSEGKLGGTQNAHSEAKSDVSNLKKRMSVPAVERPKFQCPKLGVPKLQGSILGSKEDLPTMKDSHEERGKCHGVKPVSSKPVSVAKRSGYNRFNDLVSAKGLNQMLSLKVPGVHKNLQRTGAAENSGYKLAHVNRPARVNNIMDCDVAQLRRASTDPQIVKHLVGQYRSEVMEIPHSHARSLNGITRSSSMSCPERWAGPAYSSSPAPSSLPLPKFSLVNQKLSSSDISSPLLEGRNTKLTQSPEARSGSDLPGVRQGVELDVASATRSLRRMLKLEPL